MNLTKVLPHDKEVCVPQNRYTSKKDISKITQILFIFFNLSFFYTTVNLKSVDFERGRTQSGRNKEHKLKRNKSY